MLNRPRMSWQGESSRDLKTRCSRLAAVQLSYLSSGTAVVTSTPQHGPPKMSQKSQYREAPVRFGYGLEMERFKRFRFSVPAVPLQKGFFCISAQCNRKGRFRFRFRSLENGSGGSGSAFGFRQNFNGSDGSGFRFRFGS